MNSKTQNNAATNLKLVSYRGLQIDRATGKPKAGGGVSAGLTRIWEREGAGWYFFEGNDFSFLPGGGSSVDPLASFTKDEIDTHYNFCNRVLWPLDHGLTDKVEYIDFDRRAYEAMQVRLADVLASREKPGTVMFFHDYQLALMPRLCKERGLRSMIFWHIPFTDKVPDIYLDVMITMVRGMLGANSIGFHCRSYADAFLRFVGRYIPGYDVDADNKRIFAPGESQPIKVVVEPLGIDTKNWGRMGKLDSFKMPKPLQGKKTFLVVARGDYTKAIPEVLESWRRAQAADPATMKDKVLCMIITKSREKIKAFGDEYKRIEEAYKLVDAEFPGSVYWPWNDEKNEPATFSPEDLAQLYAHTSALLIPAWVDGWNLTGPEFIAAQRAGSGAVVALSKGAGAFEKLGDLVTELTPGDLNRMAQGIQKAALLIGTPFAKAQLKALRGRVPTIDSWWNDFKALALETLAPVA